MKQSNALNYTDVRGLCSCGDFVYFAEHDSGIYELKDEISIKLLLTTLGAHGLVCISSASRTLFGVIIYFVFA